MKNEYDASVIVPTYDREKELDLTLHMLTQQKTEYRFEVLVADDGSHDNTKMIAESYRDKLDLKYLYQPDEGYRCTAARNMGIRNANGKICILIDCGVLLATDAIQYHLKIHENEIGQDCLVLGYTYANYPLEEREAREIRELVQEYDIDTVISKMPNLNQEDSREKMYQMYGDELYHWPAPWAVVYGCNLSIPRKFAEEIGMFDENFNAWGADDNEFGLRAYLNGVKIILERKASSVYYPHDSGNKMKSDPEEFIRKLNKNKEYIYQKFPLEEVRIWIDEPFYLLNQILMEKIKSEKSTVPICIK